MKDLDCELNRLPKWVGLDENSYASASEMRAANRRFMGLSTSKDQGDPDFFGRRSLLEESLEPVTNIAKEYLKRSLSGESLGYRGFDGVTYPTKEARREANRRFMGLDLFDPLNYISKASKAESQIPNLNEKKNRLLHRGLDGHDYSSLAAVIAADRRYRPEKLFYRGDDGNQYDSYHDLVAANRRFWERHRDIQLRNRFEEKIFSSLKESNKFVK